MLSLVSRIRLKIKIFKNRLRLRLLHNEITSLELIFNDKRKQLTETQKRTLRKRASEIFAEIETITTL